MSKLLAQLKQHEGIRLHPYKCSEGYSTIGYGRCLDTKGITLYEAELLLNHDIEAVTLSLRHQVDFWYQLDYVRQGVLINMAFNIGVAGLLKFKKTLNHVSDGSYELAAIEMLDSKWANQVPKRAKELSEQMATGEYK